MRKFLVALSTAVVVLGGLIAPAAAAPLPTNPVASPSTFYPYVVDGFADTTSITWSTDQVVDLQVYDQSWVLLGSRTDVQANQFTWDGDVGTNLNDALLDPGTYAFCVNSADEGSIPEDWQTADCVDVTLTHIDQYFDMRRARNGRGFDATFGTCDYTRLSKAVRVNCDAQQQRTFRYIIHKPALAFGETIVGQSVGARVDQFGGDGYVQVTRIGSKVRAYVQGHFNGRIVRVWRQFEIHREL